MTRRDAVGCCLRTPRAAFDPAHTRRLQFLSGARDWTRTLLRVRVHAQSASGTL